MSATKSKTPTRFMPPGPFQSIRLLKFYGDEAKKLTAAQITNAINGMAPFNPDVKPRAGFVEVSVSGKTITADMYVAYDVYATRFDKKGEPEKNSFVTIERGSVIIRLDQKLVEIRGSSRLASKFRSVLYEITEVRAEPLIFEKETRREIYDMLIKPTQAPPKPLDISIDHIVYIDILKKDLKKAEFRGDKLQHKAEVGHYSRMYDGTISRFTGIFIYPSNTPYKTTINFDNSSVLIFKTSDGILEKDLRWIIKTLAESSE
ncbi:hypothetical protein EU527_13395 [Candidatus Thorarchaeota archaeon]|nr:MAG: hypothetical protein EU527_13395 [Candidatus Thorarchaeota archaeon]